ncbi:MAG: glycerol-3-phosphate dehydrogenase, partial [Lachnospiraceae bacterium]|nr:glycerol-3-phosphate dehydrogenase [Lachnospiraceae bacterium]
VELGSDIILTDALGDALAFADHVFIAVEEQNLRSLLGKIICYPYQGKTFILCMKGIENHTCKRMSEVALEFVGDSAGIAVLLGPGQPKELVKQIPTRMVVDSADAGISEMIAANYGRQWIRLSVGSDLIGNEIGAAVNKMVGIAGGILDGLGCSSLKGALMVKGTREIAEMISALGGRASSAYGLCCLGDYQTSLFCETSNSVAFGRSLVSGEGFTRHVPGVFTAGSVAQIIRERQLNLPLLASVSDIVAGEGKAFSLIDEIL